MPVNRWFSGIFERVWDYLAPDETVKVTEDRSEAKPEVIRAVDAARLEWERARAYFDNVTDPDLVDHATYEIKAAERKYVYLLRRAQELGYRIEDATGLSEPVEVEA